MEQHEKPSDTLTDDELRLLRGVRESMGIKATNIEKLRELHLSGESDRLEELLEDLAYDTMDNDEAYQNLLNERKTRPNDPSISAAIRDLHGQYVKYIRYEAGLPDESLDTAIREAHDTVEEMTKDIHDPQEAMKLLGITRPAETDNSLVYRFPVEIVPRGVADKWETYLATVLAHVKSVEQLQDTGDKDDVQTKDRIRKNAHDAVTKDMERIVGGALELDFAGTRALLATIREYELKNLGTEREEPGVRSHAEKLAAQQHGLVHACEVLVSVDH